VHLSFSLCNAHPSPHGPLASNNHTDAAPAAAAALVWSTPGWEAQYLAPLVRALEPAALVTVSSQASCGRSRSPQTRPFPTSAHAPRAQSAAPRLPPAAHRIASHRLPAIATLVSCASHATAVQVTAGRSARRHCTRPQVLYFTPSRVEPQWDDSRGAFVVLARQLPLLVDPSWPLDPGRVARPARASRQRPPGASGASAPADVAAGDQAGSGRPAEALAVGDSLPADAQAALGSAMRAATDAAATARAPALSVPPGAEALPPAVLHFVLFVPPPAHRPLQLLGADGQPLPGNAFRVPGWGMLQVDRRAAPHGAVWTPTCASPPSLWGSAGVTNAACVRRPRLARLRCSRRSLPPS
jgi:hypothetical protein